MATVERTVYISDISDKEIPDDQVCTRWIGLGKKQKELHLTRKESDKFDSDFMEWIRHSRQTASSPKKDKARATERPAHSPGESAMIRAWARESGYDIGRFGRISADIIEAYNNAPDASTS